MFALIVVVVIETLLALTIGAAKESLDKAKVRPPSMRRKALKKSPKAYR